ncbi:MAG: hypothetical protein AB2A00_41155 [Myxococcota bacterium]
MNEVPYCEGSRCDPETCLDDLSTPTGPHTFLDRIHEYSDGVEYDFVHAAGPPYERDPSSNMIVYRTDRLTWDYGDVLTWQEVVGDFCGAFPDPDPSESAEWQLAVRFLDVLQQRHVVAVAVHFDNDSDCPRENLALLQARIDAQWDPAAGKERGMIIVGGDFNQRPDDESGYPESREEPDPTPWYREMSEAYGGWLRYHDTVWTRQWDGEEEENNPICKHWTRVNNIRLREVEVNDCLYECDEGDGWAEVECENHFRIDYLWVRWEDELGEVLSEDNTRGFDPRDLIETARADQGYRGGMYRSPTTGLYSDHRAVHAVIRWR